MSQCPGLENKHSENLFFFRIEKEKKLKSMSQCLGLDNKHSENFFFCQIEKEKN